MKKIIGMSILFLTIVGCNCNKIKQSTNNDAVMIEKGFQKAVIENFNDKDGCGYLIKLEEGEVYLQAQNLTESFKKDKLAVWIKYHSIKPIQGSCLTAQWIVIEDIALQ